MRCSNIPATVRLKGSLWAGDYVKKRGSDKDQTLYCWFSDSSSTFPHISVNIDSDVAPLVRFHVTFPVQKLVPKKSANWRSNETEVVESRYHVYLKIDDSDRCVIESVDSTMGWNRPEKRRMDLSFADMERQGREFGNWFYAAAMFPTPGL